MPKYDRRWNALALVPNKNVYLYLNKFDQILADIFQTNRS